MLAPSALSWRAGHHLSTDAAGGRVVGGQDLKSGAGTVELDDALCCIHEVKRFLTPGQTRKHST